MSAVKTDDKSRAVRHLSIRVPWHDSGWNGTVCKNPGENVSCLILSRIRENKDDVSEASIAGKKFSDVPQGQWPVCKDERVTFMAPFSFTREVNHPYAKTSDVHAHILPTPFRHPPYSAAAIPFRWMNKSFAWNLAEEYQLNASPDREPQEPEWLNNSPWVQAGENQKLLLEFFFSSIKKQQSLCFFYAKHTPLADDDRRVLIGVGRVSHVENPMEYKYDLTKGGHLRSFLWDVIVEHTIRPDFKDGFLLPYHSILDKAKQDNNFDPSPYVAFAPDDRRSEFSYAAEHVTHDAAIAALLACKGALEKAKDLVDEPCTKALRWIDDRLSELWKLRGPCPGIGAVLTAFGVEHSNFIAYHLSDKLQENENPWSLVEKIFAEPNLLSPELRKQINPTLQKKWESIYKDKPNRLILMKLLSRFELTNRQASRFLIPEERIQTGITCTDSQIIKNPYILFEHDRFSRSGDEANPPDPVSVWTIDRGLFPDAVVRKKHPLESPSALDGPIDPRRVRALTIERLEAAATQGHTLLPRDQVVQQIRFLDLDPPCKVDGDLYDAIGTELEPAVKTCALADGQSAFQLKRLTDVGDIIRNEIQKRMKANRHSISADWLAILMEILGPPLANDPDEIRAREEKAAALSEIANSRFSVLIGPAGTGKTTVLAALCREANISGRGILLLAPTGKARVRLWQACGLRAKTLAQFLSEQGRYEGSSGRYTCSKKDPYMGEKTVIIDEASMLTEEMLGALLDSLRGVERLILAGDPRQLPPIGAGRPFVDIVRLQEPQNVDQIFPRISPGFAELIIRRRQTSADTADLQFADWFSGRPISPGEDEIWSRIALDKDLKRLRFVRWDEADELKDTLVRILSEELELSGIDDRKGFELKLGGTLSNDRVYFNSGAGERAEAWQLLTPFRNLMYGSRTLNRLIQRQFRQGAIDWAKDSHRRPPWGKMSRITKARGPEEIVYGDKVINVANHRRKNVNPESDSLKYIANGEIGIVVGQFKAMNATWKGLPWLTKVDFSSQPGFVYDYTQKDFNEESTPLLELAYAITIHKAQGSEFRLTLLILPKDCRLMSRELIYTALTRQRDRVVVLHQGDVNSLRDYTSIKASETARRLTNLFIAPDPVFEETLFFEKGLIHRSGRGIAMRSKSEVIIADALDEAGIIADYERKFEGTDGTYRIPDFTIEDDASGVTYLWEHCGMLMDDSYRSRWATKRTWYRSQGVRPREEGKGDRAILIITEDTPEGGISSQKIRKLIKEIFG